MATPVGESADVGEIPLWDWYLIIFSIVVSVIVHWGGATLVCQLLEGVSCHWPFLC